MPARQLVLTQTLDTVAVSLPDEERELPVKRTYKAPAVWLSAA